MLKTLKYKLYLTEAQKIKIEKYSSTTRSLYNLLIAEINRTIPQIKKGGYTEKELYKLYESYAEQKPWLRVLQGKMLTDLIRDISHQSKNYARRMAKKETIKASGKEYKLPIKMKKNNKEYTYVNITIEQGKIEIEGVGEVKTKQIIQGAEVYNARCVKLDNDWYIYYCYKVEGGIKKETEEKRVIGIDMGVKNIMVCSNGVKYPSFYNIEGVRKEYKRLEQLKRTLSKKKNKSNNYKELQQKIKAKESHINNKRKNYLYGIVNELMQSNPTHIVLESESITKLAKIGEYSTPVFQQGWKLLRSYIKYKCEEKGVELIYADRWYASSKICSVCGAKKENLQVTDRLYVCTECHAVMDRDINAAINLKNLVE